MPSLLFDSDVYSRYFFSHVSSLAALRPQGQPVPSIA